MVEADQMQLAVLKRLFPSLKQVLFTAPFASVFENDQATSQWLALNYEGALYLLLDQGDKLKVVILNRKRKEDFTEDVTELGNLKTSRTEKNVYYKHTGLAYECPYRVLNFGEEEHAIRFFDLLNELKEKHGKVE